MVQIWFPEPHRAHLFMRYLARQLGFYEVPELAEWYHPEGYIADLAPAPRREQDEIVQRRAPGRAV